MPTGKITKEFTDAVTEFDDLPDGGKPLFPTAFAVKMAAADRRFTCPKCTSPHVDEKCFESSCGGYEDYKYTCRKCAHHWWVDGSDA